MTRPDWASASAVVDVDGERWDLVMEGPAVFASLVGGPSWLISLERIQQRSGEYGEDLPMAVLEEAAAMLERARRQRDRKEIADAVSVVLSWREVKPGVWHADLGGELYLRATRDHLSVIDGATTLHYSTADTPRERAHDLYLMMLGWARVEPHHVGAKKAVDCLKWSHLRGGV